MAGKKGHFIALYMQWNLFKGLMTRVVSFAYSVKLNHIALLAIIKKVITKQRFYKIFGNKGS